MNILNNRNKRTSIFKAVALCLIAAMSFTLVSCDDDMDIQQSYPFTVEVMPVPNKVVKGQTVEIRCELKKEGDFSGTLYTIRYFQFEGEGSLKMDNGITFLPNDRYLLENEKFRLYYTAAGDEAHNFIVVVEDNFSNSYELEFDFNNRNVKDDDLTIVPIGNFSPLLNDACIHDNALFTSDGLFCVRADQPPRGNGRAGGNLPTAAYGTCFFYAAATLKAGTQKNTTHTSVGVTNFCQTRSIRHEP